MRRAGQALRHAAAFLVALALLLGAGLTVAVWRLSTAPVEAALLARAIEHAANALDAPLRLSVGRASLAWQGFRAGDSPLEVRLGEVRLTDATGATVALLPDAAATLALAPLLRGVLAPATLDLERPALRLRRDAEGALALAGPDDAARPAPRAGQPAAEEAGGLLLLLGELLAPPEERAARAALRRLSIRGGRLSIVDAREKLEWDFEGVDLSLRRLPGGGLEGDGEARLTVRDTAGPRLALPVHLSGRGEAPSGPLRLRLDLPLLHPAELAAVLPRLAPLAALDAPLALQARASFDGKGRPLDGGLSLQAPHGGLLRTGAGLDIPFARLEADLAASPERLVLEGAELRLAGEAGATLSASGALARDAEGWSGPLDLRIEGLDLAEIPRLWPANLAPETREAVQLSVSEGRLRRASLRLEARGDAALGAWSASGGWARIELEELRITPPGIGPIRLAAAALQGAAAPGLLRLEAAQLRLPAPARDAPSPRLEAAGDFVRAAEGGWRGALELALDATRFQDLPALWPAGLAEGARAWITANVTEGAIREGRWRLGLFLPGDGAGPRLESLSGEARAEAAVVHFLRPMPPVRGAAATARFAPGEIALEVSGGALSLEAGRPPVQLRSGSLRFLLAPPEEPDRAELALEIGGPLAELGAALRHPRLRLFDRRPFPVTIAGGAFEGRLSLAFPLLDDLPLEQVRLQAEGQVGGGRFARLLFERDVEEAALEFQADLDQLRLSGGASLAGIPLRYALEADFRSGPPQQVVVRDVLTARATASQLAALGLDAGALLAGPVAIEARGEQRRNGQGGYQLSLGLREARLAFPPLGWRKPAGAEARAEAQIRLANGQLTGIEGIRISGPELALRGRAQARAGRIERIELQDSALGASRFAGDLRAPAAPGEPWSVLLRGPALDLAPRLAGGGGAEEPAGGAENPPPLALDLRFDQVLLGPGREVFAVQARGRLDGEGVLRAVELRGRTARTGGLFQLSLAPAPGGARTLNGTAEDGGALLRALGLTGGIEGGRLTLSARYAETRPGAALSGTAELEGFAARDAPAIGKLLQAVTVFGILDAVQGGAGLSFQRAVVPFTLTPAELRIEDARAFSASLGLTARGRWLRDSHTLDFEGTIVPAYVLNSLLGNLPLIGRLFSPEQGGGVFAASFRVRGSADDPEVSLNPLAAVTPGFLRGLFGLVQDRSGDGGGGARR